MNMTVNQSGNKGGALQVKALIELLHSAQSLEGTREGAVDEIFNHGIDPTWMGDRLAKP